MMIIRIHVQLCCSLWIVHFLSLGILRNSNMLQEEGIQWLLGCLKVSVQRKRSSVSQWHHLTSFITPSFHTASMQHNLGMRQLSYCKQHNLLGLGNETALILQATQSVRPGEWGYVALILQATQSVRPGEWGYVALKICIYTASNIIWEGDKASSKFTHCKRHNLGRGRG